MTNTIIVCIVNLTKIAYVDDLLTLFSTTNREFPTLTNIDFERQDLVTSIMQISNNSAAGPDNFPVILLKNAQLKLVIHY